MGDEFVGKKPNNVAQNPGRREFLQKTLGGLGAVAGLGALPPVIARALATHPRVVHGSIDDVKHIVILMQENRSFDHYFGTLRGVRGFGDRFPIPLASGQPVWFESDGTSIITPYHLDSTTSCALLVPGTPHAFSDAQAAWNQGKYGEWPLYKTPYSMGHYQREDIPFQFALAEAFTICDSYHCSVTGGTDPNRIMFFSGSNFDPAFGQLGFNCTEANAEPDNSRCVVSGTMPSPGYTYTNTAFNWDTLPDVLERAGIGWRIYQDPNDNWNGLMHGGLAFQSFREAAPGSPIYGNGMSLWSLEDLRNDVANGTLPAVSWVLPNPMESEHPGTGNPDRGGDFTSQVLEAITSNPESWASTVFFLTYDENDGFFDHVPPPAVPSYNADGTLAGKSTIPLDGEFFSDPDGAYLDPRDTISGTVRPWGLGPRVPMYVISPWSKGGWVNSQVFDHTSIAMFLEKRFQVTVDTISPWHRAICGDLTSAFDFTNTEERSFPTLPNTGNFATVEAQQKALPMPLPPVAMSSLFQESGTRASRALPYALHVTGSTRTASAVSLEFANIGAQGAVFHVYDMLHLDRIPRRYTVEAGQLLSDDWLTNGDAGEYELWVYSTNGFVRSFKGNTVMQMGADFRPQLSLEYLSSGIIVLGAATRGDSSGLIEIAANAYRTDGPWKLEMPARSARSIRWNLAASGHWYDFTATADNVSFRFAGRLENGMHSMSDPAMASGL